MYRVQNSTSDQWHPVILRNINFLVMPNQTFWSVGSHASNTVSYNDVDIIQRNGEFNMRAGVLLLMIDLIMVTSFTVSRIVCFYHTNNEIIIQAASVIGILTYRNILRAYLLSFRARIFHRKLLIALCAQVVIIWLPLIYKFQTFVPLIFVYVPYFCIGTFPFFGWPDHHISDASGVLTSSFPVWVLNYHFCITIIYSRMQLWSFIWWKTIARYSANPSLVVARRWLQGLWRLVLCGKKPKVAATGWKSISRQIVVVSTLTHQ